MPSDPSGHWTQTNSELQIRAPPLLKVWGLTSQVLLIGKSA